MSSDSNPHADVSPDLQGVDSNIVEDSFNSTVPTQSELFSSSPFSSTYASDGSLEPQSVDTFPLPFATEETQQHEERLSNACKKSPSPLSPPPPAEEQPDGGNLLMKLGTLVVIGAMAANVIGFRYSRWAVGKDIHRAWERRQRQSASFHSNARARAEEELRRIREAYARAEQREKEEAAARAQRAKSREHEKREYAEREKRERVRKNYTQWERQFDRGNGTYTEHFRMDFDPKVFEEMVRQFRQTGRMGFGAPRGFGFDERLFEEMLRQSRQASRVGFGAGSRGFGFDERLFEELFKAARQAEQQSGNARSQQDFESFRFWEAMNGAEWRDFAREGRSGGGVHRRGGMARHYQALGLQEGASEEEVKKAYRRGVMRWHPDRYRGTDKQGAARKFREVTDAYAALSKK
ncbi:DnaJ-like [Gracilariopsis chorda]|uniref:DnaJ-like n=1 Tax=Gracilariopsis chorda TaxID=448386 RepID=A0A2V3IX16_9FLOR|nr:DnaJ-like [Gracilariopsis chorda]|eukprot:PXF46682.1 DnaJ-like [Gracilariopsis chorda]